jgi:exonuclease V
VHEIVRVVTVTQEDRWAVTLLDTYNQLSTVAAGSLEREINVFGDLFDRGILLKGIIDQVQFSKETGELTVLDFKTRRTNSMPSEAQKRGHALQLMLYKCMLDSLTSGITKMDLLAKHLNLNFKRELTEGVLEHIGRYGMWALFAKSKITAASVGENIQTSPLVTEGAVGFKVTLGEVAAKISELIVGLNLPLVSSLMVEYVYQQTHEEIGVEVIEYDEPWARKAFENSLDFWVGKREPRGVDLEELWKCEMCQFKDVCVWRRQKVLEQSPVATRPGNIKF